MSPYYSSQQFDYDIPMCVFIYTYAACGSLSFLNPYICVFQQIEKI